MREPDFADIIHFADDKATLANDPLYSKDVLSGFVDKKEASNRRKQQKTYLTVAEEKTGGNSKCLPVVSEEPWFRKLP